MYSIVNCNSRSHTQRPSTPAQHSPCLLLLPPLLHLTTPHHYIAQRHTVHCAAPIHAFYTDLVDRTGKIGILNHQPRMSVLQRHVLQCSHRLADGAGRTGGDEWVLRPRLVLVLLALNPTGMMVHTLYCVVQQSQWCSGVSTVVENRERERERESVRVRARLLRIRSNDLVRCLVDDASDRAVC